MRPAPRTLHPYFLFIFSSSYFCSITRTFASGKTEKGIFQALKDLGLPSGKVRLHLRPASPVLPVLCLLKSCKNDFSCLGFFLRLPAERRDRATGFHLRHLLRAHAEDLPSHRHRGALQEHVSLRPAARRPSSAPACHFCCP